MQPASLLHQHLQQQRVSTQLSGWSALEHKSRHILEVEQ
jgi:hypothetical protein